MHHRHVPPPASHHSLLGGLRHALHAGTDPHASEVIARYRSNGSLIYRIFRVLLHGWTTLVWFGMCLAVGGVVSVLWAADPVLAILAAIILAAFISLGSLLGGVRTARSVFTQTLVRAAVLALLIHLLL